MKTPVGILKPTRGTISVKGYDIVKDPKEARRIIGYLPENLPSILVSAVKSHVVWDELFLSDRVVEN